MTQAFIVDGVRTPIGKFGGTLAPVRADDLAAIVIRELLKKVFGTSAPSIDEVILGCANQAGEDNRNVARMALLLAGLPYTTPGETVNRLCASGMSAVIQASRAIQCLDADLMIAGGVEQMTRAPWVMSKSSQPFGRDVELFDSSFGWRFINPHLRAQYGVDAMGETAENLAEMFNISREDQDKFACWSQQKAATATQNGRLATEIVPVAIPQRKGDPLLFAQDEFIKADTTISGLAGLSTAFRPQDKGGSVTAGNSSGLNDGAAALLLASEKGLQEHGLSPLARIVSSGVVGVLPRIMGIGPVEASQKALKKAGLTLDKVDVIEINEAFAAQVLACTRQLGIQDDDPRLNPNGGGIALGHPLGMSGSRILLSAAKELHNSNKRYALATMCIGVGQGFAVVLERVD
jgi:3-oxoadipyl-CoA thiolase